MLLPIRTRSSEIRKARKADAREIAKLFLISSDGLAAYIWSKVQAPGMSLEDVGAARYARERTMFSYENCMMAERGGEIAGLIHCHETAAASDEVPESDPVLRPYMELEVAASLYVGGVAVYDKFRGMGVGTDLMEAAFAHARELGLGKVSLICFERNTGAMRLYERLGFAEIDRRAVVPHPTLHYSDGDAILMAREV